MNASPFDAPLRRADLTVLPGEGVDRGSVEHSHLPDGGLIHPEDPNFRAFHSFAQYLTTRPSQADITQFLVGMLNWPIDANGCLIVSATDSPRELIAEFVDVLHPWAGAARTRLVPGDVAALLDSGAVVVSAYWDPPAAGTNPHFGVWTLGSPAEPLAYLVVTFRTHQDIAAVEALVRPLAGLFAIYLAGIESAEHAHARTDARPGAGAMAPSCPTALNDRQREILMLMALGLTNPQIAARIGFSESTVRMESLSIYRYLGVHDRHDAVIAGQRAGLIPPVNQR